MAILYCAVAGARRQLEREAQHLRRIAALVGVPHLHLAGARDRPAIFAAPAASVLAKYGVSTT